MISETWHEQLYKQYSIQATAAACWITIGIILAIAGFTWAMDALNITTTQTADGTLIDGNATTGLFYGQALAVLGVLLISFGIQYYQSARRKYSAGKDRLAQYQADLREGFGV